MVSPSSVQDPSSSVSRGSDRLLWDCATVGRVLEAKRVSARARLEADLGHDLTRVLLLTLREPEPRSDGSGPGSQTLLEEIADLLGTPPLLGPVTLELCRDRDELVFSRGIHSRLTHRHFRPRT